MMNTIECKIHCAASPLKIYQLIDSNEGRRRFWAESADEMQGVIHFIFPNGQTNDSSIIRRIPPLEFSLQYFDSPVTFQLTPADDGGTDITLTHRDVAEEDYAEIRAGWVSVLLALKACADFGVDLRNHSPTRHWDTGYVDN